MTGLSRDYLLSTIMYFNRFIGIVLGVILGCSVMASNRVVSIQYESIQGTPVSTPIAVETQLGKPVDTDALNRDIQRLYAGGRFRTVTARVEPQTQGQQVVFVLDPYPIVTDIQVTGVSVFSPDAFTLGLETQVNRPVRLAAIRSDQAHIVTRYRELGYRFARLESIDLVTQSVHIRVNEGRVATLNIHGLTQIPASIILRDIRQQPGVAYNQRLWDRDQQRMANFGYVTGLYSYVTPTQDNRVVIDMFVNDTDINMFSLGLEQTNASFATMAEFKKYHTLVDSDSVSVRSQISWEDSFAGSYYQLQYHQPWILNRYPVFMTWDLMTKAQRQGVQNDLIASRVNGWRLTVGHLFDPYLVSVQYKKDAVSPMRAGDFSGYHLEAMRWRFAIQGLDSPRNPTRGVYAQVDYERSGHILGMPVPGVDYSKFTVNQAAFYPLHPKHIVGMRNYYGYLESLDANTQIQQYVLGGVNTLRGYAYAEFIGDRVILSSLEYRYHWSSKWQWVVFVDAGDAYQKAEKIRALFGYGTGMRYVSRIGLFRLDVGRGNDYWHAYFTVGQAF